MKRYYYILALTIVSVFGIAFFFFPSFRLKIDNSSLLSQAISPTLEETENIPEGYVKYKNDKYSFYFYYPNTEKVTEYDMGEGATTVTLESEGEVHGMQIFVVPYWEETISEKRFKSDVPSGIRTNVEKSFVNGVEAVTFNSVDENLGSTKEVWIIRGGYLYEITVPEEASGWLSVILETWKFL